MAPRNSNQVRSASAQDSPIFRWLLAVVWLAVIQIFNPPDFWTHWGRLEDSGRALIFHAIGLVLVALAVRVTLSRLRFGWVTLRASFPGRLGERLEGEVNIPRMPEEFTGPIEGGLRCQSVYHRERGMPSYHNLWSAPVELTLARDGMGGTLKFSVDVPSDQPETLLRESGGHAQTCITWELWVSVSMNGQDLKRTFPIPISASNPGVEQP